MKMLLLVGIFISIYITPIIYITEAVQFPVNPTPEISIDEKSLDVKKTTTVKVEPDAIGTNYESDTEKTKEEPKEQVYLEEAMKAVLDPTSVITKEADIILRFRMKLSLLDRENMTLDEFMYTMDELNLEVCKKSQEALWSYVIDVTNDAKKNYMVSIVGEEEEIKKKYWEIMKQRYLDQLGANPKLIRKIRIIRERGTNVLMSQSKQREEIDNMQRIWTRVSICPYNMSCMAENSNLTMSEITSIFTSSDDIEELVYYWKAYRDGIGRKIRPIFKKYVEKMNRVAEKENFSDAGDMWRYAFEDESFIETVHDLWKEIKPMYDLLHDYVRLKLKTYYADQFQSENDSIPAHLLGNLWAQEWQAVYSKVAPYPDSHFPKPVSDDTIDSKYLFDVVDQFHQSMGFESAKDAYQGIDEVMTTSNCLPSSHDMCDGVNYRIKWCGEKVADISVGLSRAARLLGHVQYFKHYRHLPLLYRDGPNPAFHEAFSDIVSLQVTNPKYMKRLNTLEVQTSPEATLNFLLWLALEKFPLTGYAYILDKWRWDVFANSTMENLNQKWWDLRIEETGITPPVPRNESDLDPAAKYHVVSHVQYITYLISHVLEFQILLSLCKAANHTGPLHECLLYDVKEAGKLLGDGMSLGASEDWRTVLKSMTGETELSTKGILAYFSTLETFLKKENTRLAQLRHEDMDKSAPIIVGVIVILLTILIILLYCVKKHNLGNKISSVCGLKNNGSLDIATNVQMQGKTNDTGISEEKV